MTPVVEGRAIVQDYHVPGSMMRRAKTVWQAALALDNGGRTADLPAALR